MINGIEILQEKEVLKTNPKLFIIMGIITLLLLLLIYIIGHKICKNTNMKLFIIMELTWISMIIICILFIKFQTFPIKTGKYEYTVKINDNVSLNDFYKKYNILNYDKNNNIYIIEDK